MARYYTGVYQDKEEWEGDVIACPECDCGFTEQAIDLYAYGTASQWYAEWTCPQCNATQMESGEW